MTALASRTIAGPCSDLAPTSISMDSCPFVVEKNYPITPALHSPNPQRPAPCSRRTAPAPLTTPRAVGLRRTRTLLRRAGHPRPGSRHHLRHHERNGLRGLRRGADDEGLRRALRAG